MIDVGILIKGFIAILESRASFIGATALEVGFGVFLYRHPDNETYLFWVIVLGVAIFLRAFLFFYDNYQSQKYREDERLSINERKIQDETERQKKELAEAKHVYERLNSASQELLYSISKIAIKSPIEGTYIVKDKDTYCQLIFDLINLLNRDFTLAEWVDYDEYGDSFTFAVKPPLDKLIEKSINP